MDFNKIASQLDHCETLTIGRDFKGNLYAIGKTGVCGNCGKTRPIVGTCYCSVASCLDCYNECEESTKRDF